MNEPGFDAIPFFISLHPTTSQLSHLLPKRFAVVLALVHLHGAALHPVQQIKRRGAMREVDDGPRRARAHRHRRRQPGQQDEGRDEGPAAGRGDPLGVAVDAGDGRRGARGARGGRDGGWRGLHVGGGRCVLCVVCVWCSEGTELRGERVRACECRGKWDLLLGRRRLRCPSFYHRTRGLADVIANVTRGAGGRGERAQRRRVKRPPLQWRVGGSRKKKIQRMARRATLLTRKPRTYVCVWLRAREGFFFFLALLVGKTNEGVIFSARLVPTFFLSTF